MTVLAEGLHTKTRPTPSPSEASITHQRAAESNREEETSSQQPVDLRQQKKRFHATNVLRRKCQADVHLLYIFTPQAAASQERTVCVSYPKKSSERLEQIIQQKKPSPTGICSSAGKI